MSEVIDPIDKIPLDSKLDKHWFYIAIGVAILWLGVLTLVASSVYQKYDTLTDILGQSDKAWNCTIETKEQGCLRVDQVLQIIVKENQEQSKQINELSRNQ